MAEITISSSVFAYYDEVKAKKVYQSLGYSTCTFISDLNTSTQLYVLSNDKHLVIAFRGSEPPDNKLVDLEKYTIDNQVTVDGILSGFKGERNLLLNAGLVLDIVTKVSDLENTIKDALTDISIGMIAIDNKFDEDLNSPIKVHSGFYKAYMAIREDLISLIKDSKLSEIIITGHSLGAALSTLCALDLKLNLIMDNYNPNISLYNYASPLVGGDKFVELFNENVDESYGFFFSNGDWMNFANLFLWTLDYRPVHGAIDLGKGSHDRNVYKRIVSGLN
jgi:predicted lipase